MSEETTLIGKGIRIEGEITGKAPIEVWGEIKGTAGTEGEFSVREGGKVNGEVAARSVVIEGQVDGQVTAEQKIELRATCKVHGQLTTKSLAIADSWVVLRPWSFSHAAR